MRLYCRKYPFGLQKLEASASGFHQVEVIYTEKMITLSNVSLRKGFLYLWETAVTHLSCGFAAIQAVKQDSLFQKWEHPQRVQGWDTGVESNA